MFIGAQLYINFVLILTAEKSNGRRWVPYIAVGASWKFLMFTFCADVQY